MPLYKWRKNESKVTISTSVVSRASTRLKAWGTQHKSHRGPGQWVFLTVSVNSDRANGTWPSHQTTSPTKWPPSTSVIAVSHCTAVFRCEGSPAKTTALQRFIRIPILSPAFLRRAAVQVLFWELLWPAAIEKITTKNSDSHNVWDWWSWSTLILSYSFLSQVVLTK